MSHQQNQHVQSVLPLFLGRILVRPGNLVTNNQHADMFMTNICGSFPVSELWTHSHTVLTTISQVSTRRIYLW